jgi:hypothetical protein
LVTYPKEGDNHWKRWLIPHTVPGLGYLGIKAPALWEGPAAHQLVGRVMAYQGKDG